MPWLPVPMKPTVTRSLAAPAGMADRTAGVDIEAAAKQVRERFRNVLRVIMALPARHWMEPHHRTTATGSSYRTSSATVAEVAPRMIRHVPGVAPFLRIEAPRSWC
jgi:hypothetical protein